MADLIDRDIVVDRLNKLCDRVCVYSKAQRKVMCGACPLGDAFTVIEDDIHTISRGKGKWSATKPNPRTWSFRCSECGNIAYYPTPKYFTRGCEYKYCPWCGAEMEVRKGD